MPAAHGRRHVLRWGMALPVLAGLAALSPWRVRAAGKTDVLLLSCMDFRLMDDIGRYMAERGFHEKYDHLVLAGASLGAVNDKYPAWRKTFWDHVDLAVQLHQIERLVVMDHRDCGAYRLLVGAEQVDTPEKETAAHAQQLAALRSITQDRYPNLKVETLLMGLDGKVEALG